MLVVAARVACGLTIGTFAWPASGARARLATMASASKIPQAVEAPISLTSVAVDSSGDSPAAWSGDLLVLPIWEAAENSSIVLNEAQAAVDAAYGGALENLIEDFEFKGKAGSSAVVGMPRSAPARRLAVVGLGKEDAFKAGGASKLGAALATLAKDQKAKTMATVLPGADSSLQLRMLESLYLGLSPDTRYKSKADADENKPPPLANLALLGGGADAATIGRAKTMAAGVLLTRGLVGSPANYLTPATMAETAASLAAEFGTLSLSVLEKDECEARGMGAYLGVAQGCATTVSP